MFPLIWSYHGTNFVGATHSYTRWSLLVYADSQHILFQFMGLDSISRANPAFLWTVGICGKSMNRQASLIQWATNLCPVMKKVFKSPESKHSWSCAHDNSSGKYIPALHYSYIIIHKNFDLSWQFVHDYYHHFHFVHICRVFINHITMTTYVCKVL